MSKRAPSTTQLLVIAGFALSCFGILLFLWITFGGPTPFKARSYEVKIPFNEATQLAEQSDVRISGVSVGKVQGIEVAPSGQRALATIAIQDKYGPIPANTRAVLRTKTLLGETYVELTPGDGGGQPLEDGGTLSRTNVAESVQLDEIFRTFDERTRAAFQEWMREGAVAIQGRGQDFSNAIAEFEPFFTEFDKLFRVLDTQRLAVRQLFRNGAVSLNALRGREGQLANLIQSSNAVFRTTAARDRDIEALFRAFPTFEDEQRLTLNRLREFAINTDPLMRQLVPAAEELSPTLISFSRLAPQAKGLFEALEPVIDRAPTGFPALRKLFRDQFPPLLRSVDPFLRNLNPILKGLDLYKKDLAGTLGNVAAAANANVLNSEGKKSKFLRATGPFGPESLAPYANRTTVNRNNAYAKPGSGERVAEGLLNFLTAQCTSGITATLDPDTPEDPAFRDRLKRPPEDETSEEEEEEKLDEESEKFFERLKLYALAEEDGTAGVPAPGCERQAPFKSIYGGNTRTLYQHVFEQNR